MEREANFMKRLTLTLGLIGMLSVASFSAAAQARRSNQVCVYENNHFGGWEQCFLPGEQIGDLGDHRNKISSIRIYGDARITIFANKNFEGASMEVASTLNDLAQQSLTGGIIPGTWNDVIESVRVTGRNNVNTRDDVYRDDRDTRVDPRDSRVDPRDVYRDDRRGNRNNNVCIYEDIDFRGRYQCFESRDEIADLGRSTGWNDRISSIRVYGVARVTLYRDINFRGDRVTLDRDVPDLRRVRMTGSLSWDNQVSSLDINGGRGRAYGRDNRR